MTADLHGGGLGVELGDEAVHRTKVRLDGLCQLAAGRLEVLRS